ncbi:hypothetical protein [Nocardiopsis sp. NPDC006832]|uniref:hypothetical protein n=1 Tax=Nocardiopsis sp. NPDC006832 TaxID=3157188 RepID=UPI0033C31D3A
MSRLTREEVVAVFREIIDVGIGAGDEDVLERDITLLEQGIPCPYVSDLLFWPDKYVEAGDDPNDLGPERLAELAMRHRPIEMGP